MLISIITALISAASAICVALIGARAKAAEARTDAREKRRERESLLSMAMMDASIQLSIVSANALSGGHNNGNVEQARKAAEKARADYEQFLREVTAHAVNGGS